MASMIEALKSGSVRAFTDLAKQNEAEPEEEIRWFSDRIITLEDPAQLVNLDIRSDTKSETRR
jgi:hypothetical protein